MNVIDDVVPTAPTGLDGVGRRPPGVDDAPVVDRADDGGAPVTGYQIRYAKVPIDASNFDDLAVTTAGARTPARRPRPASPTAST